ncbi:nitrite/sulfite reductase [Neptunomonas concharum]|uniref:Nitrite/sulfite reductase n=1 Tax=Neptunomonas concharum TaxID=1031538 RepID=A0A5P1R919_9GAMM|nr:nitrite/sulfite reductase [Neptunomonas concharum]QEQ96088.1 nitrite/sulfite reductase [Neptunomonas concharum]
MYQYNEVDQTLVNERVEQFRDQTRRFLAGELPEDEFLALRLMNGLYVQRHAPMLRVAIPYGLFSSEQMRKLAHISRKYDKGYGHFTTRTNIQFNWPKLEEVPDILAELAQVQMHAIQTSGNCIRNTTTDPFSGILSNELEDPRPYCEIIRQWSTLHPEFAYLPRKFKIAVTGAPEDRAASQVHDIGLHLVKNAEGEIGFEVLVGGGLGRTPVIGKVVREFLPKQHLLSYLDAILRVYNLNGRRDNKYKARIKILVNALGVEEFTRLVEAEWEFLRDGELTLTDAEIERAKSFFKPFDYDPKAAEDKTLADKLSADQSFATWYEKNTREHKVEGYRAVIVSLKPYLKPAGDITDVQMDLIADLAEQYSFGEIRSTHDQNLVLADVKKSDLFAVWQALDGGNMARPNIGTLTDMIVCPGFDFCALANARTLNIADQINEKFDDLDYLYELGDINVNMSGCINACGHHHVADIGILGVDKKGEDWYQITLGGSSREDARLGKILGKAVAADEVANTIESILGVFVEHRLDNELFRDTVQRIGMDPFKENVYAVAH